MARERKYKTAFDVSTEIFTKSFVDGTELAVDISKLPEVSKLHIIGYGITQLMNDTHSGESDIGEIIKLSQQKAEDLANGVIRRRAGEGLGLGVNLEILTRAVAAVQFAGDEAKATEVLAKFIPSEDDDEETTKGKKARLRGIRNAGVIKAKIDELQGKNLGDLLTDLPEPAIA
jgi:hypothetical protein